jgi:hypothetical protein
MRSCPPAVKDERLQTKGHNLPPSAPFIILVNRGQEALRPISYFFMQYTTKAVYSPCKFEGVKTKTLKVCDLSNKDRVRRKKTS